MLVEQILLATRKLFSKKQEKMSKENSDKKIFYVWTKTERIGQIVEVSKEQKDSKWLEFTDGTRCNTSLVSEMLMNAKDENQANSIAKDFGGINFLVSENLEQDDSEIVDASPARPRPKPIRPRKNESEQEPINVMLEMLRKMSTKNKADMPVSVNIPSKEVYDLLKDQMDTTKKELNSQIGELVESQIDNLREQLKEQIESFIINYYNNGRTDDTTNS
tara:strand:- start:40907 stop:41563 length:657 start_codon:yes stop_codon:yes gene_type:complete